MTLIVSLKAELIRLNGLLMKGSSFTVFDVRIFLHKLTDVFGQITLLWLPACEGFPFTFHHVDFSFSLIASVKLYGLVGFTVLTF